MPPKPFTINNIYTTNNNNNLQITIKKTNNNTQIFTIPYSSIPLLQHKKHTHYSITTKKYHNKNTQQKKPHFFQNTLLHNLPTN